MPKRKAFSVKARAAKKAKNRFMVKKKGKKKKGGADWYTADGSLGIFGGMDKRKRKAEKLEKRRAKQEALEMKNRDMEIIGQSGSDDELEDDEDEDLDVEREAVSSAYIDLISSLQKDKDKLDHLERSVLEKVEREQEGIEEGYSSSDQEEEGEDIEEESDGEDDQDVQDQDDQDDDADLLDSNSGKNFDARFVNSYGLDEDGLEGLAKQSRETKFDKEKVKVDVEDVQYVVSIIKTQQTPGSSNPNETTTFRAVKAIDASEDSLYERYEIKQRLGKQWLEYASRRHKICTQRLGDVVAPKRNKYGLTNLQSRLIRPLTNYVDTIFNDRNLGNASEIRELYILHAMNHVFKTADLVRKHDLRLKVRATKEKQNKIQNIVDAVNKTNGEHENNEEEGGDEDEDLDQICRDQGFTRPRVLILVPNRLAALRIVRLMIGLMPEGARISNKSKFWDEFSEQHEEDEKDAKVRARREKLPAPEAFDELFYNAQVHPVQLDDMERRKGIAPRPGDWHDTFTGNHDECFRMGISMTGRKSFNLFSDFYRSDIILASPLGIRLATGQEMGDEEAEENGDGMVNGEEDENLADFGLDAKEEKTRKEKRKTQEQTDFLSSIEMCIVDQADVLEMQNWQHLVDVMNALNRKPFEIRQEMDFARIRPYFLIPTGPRRFRQTLVFSQYATPYINSVFVPHTHSRLNVAGVQQWKPKAYDGVLLDIDVEDVTHRYVRLPDGDDDEDEEEVEEKKLNYFAKKIMPTFKSEQAAHTLVIVPSYFDFISVRNLFRQTAKDLGETGERARGKPWKRKSKSRAVGKDGKRIGKTKLYGEPTQALFVAVSEYTEPDQITRARGDFYHGRARIMLITERFYFYHRYRLRGIQRIVCFSPLTHAHFYTELCNLAPGNTINLTLVEPKDALSLERVVGTQNAKRILAQQDDSQNIKVFNFQPK